MSGRMGRSTTLGFLVLLAGAGVARAETVLLADGRTLNGVKVKSGPAPDRVVLDSLEAHGTRTIVSPMRISGLGVRHGVFAGPFATKERADSARAALVRGRLIPAGGGAVASRPMSVALSGPLTAAAAAAERARLRRAGVATFVLGHAGGTVRLYTGAFGRTVSMSMLQDLLTPTGGAGELVPRAGYVP